MISSYFIVIRCWHGRRVVAKLKDEAAIQLVVMETMMESIVMSDQWDRQCQLNRTDLMVTQHQLHLVETMMAQVTG